jgi:signal transduction histidine kinase
VKIYKRQLPGLLIVVGSLLLLLPLLAYLQYDWLGKVSEREREQMQSALRLKLSQFSADFDREITRIFLQFESRPDRFQNPIEDYAKIYAHWKSTAPHPEFIRDILFLQSENLRHLNAASGVWEPADWITEFGPRRELIDPVDPRIPAIIIPVFPLTFGTQPEVFPFREVTDRLIIRLNLDYIQKQFIPSLARSDLAGILGDYRIQINSEGEGARIIYSSDSATSIQTESDAAEHILAVRPGDFRSLVLTDRPVIATAPLARVESDRMFSVQLMPGIGMAHAIPGEPPQMFTNSWKVSAIHRSGSLDAAVGQLRRRNLAMSFGILGLLSASVIIILISTVRAQGLAQQQMEFVSTVSHELRTPLAVICSAGENLADGVVRDTEQLKNYGKVVRNEGRRLSEMVEQILSFAGVQSGLKKQILVPTDLTHIVDRAIAALESPLRDNGFTLEKQIADDLPPVMGDSASLTRAVQNLISNAIKYGGSERWIGLSVFTEGVWIKIAVQDRGPGISSSDLPHIFEPFYRGRSAVAAQIQGSGLGLSLVKQTVEAHGGRIDLSTNQSTGSTFCISLPIARTENSSI